MQLSGEVHQRGDTSAAGEESFLTESTAERPGGDRSARVPAREEPSVGAVAVEQLDHCFGEDFGQLDRFSSDRQRHGARGRIDLCAGDRCDAGQVEPVEQDEQSADSRHGIHVVSRDERACHRPPMVGGVVAPFEAMAAELDPEAAQAVPSQPPGVRREGIPL